MLLISARPLFSQMKPTSRHMTEHGAHLGWQAQHPSQESGLNALKRLVISLLIQVCFPHSCHLPLTSTSQINIQCAASSFPAHSHRKLN